MPSAMPEADPYEHRISLVDVVMISLAIVSVLILAYEQVYDPSPERQRLIIYIDLGIVAIFAVEFIVRISRAQDKMGYVKGHWYDLVGMIPVSHPLFRGFRLARLVRLFVLTSRFVRATNRSFGEAFVETMVGRYKDIFVEGISDRIVLRLLDETEAVLTRGAYGTAAARALDSNRDELIKKINVQLKKDRATRLLMGVPGMERMLEGVQERTITTVVATLGSEEMNQTILSVIREILGDLRRATQQKEWRAPAATGPAEPAGETI